MLLIPSLKKKTKQIDIAVLDDPEVFYMPLQGYAGELTLLVAVGEQVAMYQLIAASSGLLAAKMHAPVSGIIIGITDVADQRCVLIKNDFRYTALPVEQTDPNACTKADFLQILMEAGVEGSGGARFPAHVKYRFDRDELDTFIINGVECEPYLSADYVLMKSASANLMRVLALLHRILAPKKIVFAIERQHRELAVVLQQAAAELSLPITIKTVSDGYPQGGELQLIKSVTGLELPKGSIPAQHAVLVSNVGTLWAMYKALFEGQPYTERIVTISGNKSKTMGNYRVKIGTPVAHLLEQTANGSASEQQTVIIGGPMMGKAVTDPMTPIHKGVGGLLILEHVRANEMNCIACGYCVDVCPQRLMPLEFVRHNQDDNVMQLDAYHLNDCITCGACAYVCPSDVPLMHHIISGKEKLAKLKKPF